MMITETQKTLATGWFRELRDQLCSLFEALEDELSESDKFPGHPPGRFTRTAWERPQGGGGEMSVMKGRVFEKVGVNISTVHGEFSEIMRKEIPGADHDPRFWASGISLVAHMHSPLVPAVHMNTRMIAIGDGSRHWFGGGSDLNPMYPDEQDTQDFHNAFQQVCDAFDPSYYEKFKQWC